jgi:hypothetical protein
MSKEIHFRFSTNNKYNTKWQTHTAITAMPINLLICYWNEREFTLVTYHWGTKIASYVYTTMSAALPVGSSLERKILTYGNGRLKLVPGHSSVSTLIDVGGPC